MARLRSLGMWATFAGVALLLAAAALSVAKPEWIAARGVVVLAGAACLLLALYASFGAVRAFFGRRATRYGINALVMVLLVLGIIVLVEVLSYRHPYRLDLTENQRHSLSPQTIKVLRNLRTNVEVTGFFGSAQPGKLLAEDLFEQYASYSNGKFTGNIVDLDRNPALARRYEVDAYGTVVLDTEARSEKIFDPSEEKLTNALVKITREGKRIVYVVKGHGEHEISDTDRSGFSAAKAAMEQVNYEVKDLVLIREANVPADADVVIMPGPRTDPLPHELDALTSYIGRGGKVLFMVNPFEAEGLKKYLAKYGVDLGGDVVIELNPVGQLFGIGPNVPVIDRYETHPITRAMGGVATLFPITRSVARAKTTPKGVSVQTLAHTSSQSWGETDLAFYRTGQAKRDPEDNAGPLPVAAVATVDAINPPEGKGNVKARIVVFGTSSLAANQFLNAQGNKDLFLNTVSWLAEEEDLIAIRPKSSRQTPVFLTAVQGRVIFWIPVVVLPGVVTVLGISVWIRRRYAN